MKTPYKPQQLLECVLADVCLQDYWSGHHLPHVLIVADPSLSQAAIRREILNELAMGAVAGADYDPDNLLWYTKAKTAVSRWRAHLPPGDPRARRPFKTVEQPADPDDYDGWVYAVFVFRPRP